MNVLHVDMSYLTFTPVFIIVLIFTRISFVVRRIVGLPLVSYNLEDPSRVSLQFSRAGILKNGALATYLMWALWTFFVILSSDIATYFFSVSRR